MAKKLRLGSTSNHITYCEHVSLSHICNFRLIFENEPGEADYCVLLRCDSCNSEHGKHFCKIVDAVRFALAVLLRGLQLMNS